MSSLVHQLAIPDFPMTAKTSTNLSNVHITVEVAVYGLRKALRPFLKRPGLHFTAAVVLPDADEIATYHEAMKRIFADEPRVREDWDEEVTVVKSFKDLDDAASLSSLYQLRPVKRTVLLLAREDRLPDRVLLAIDVVTTVAPPEPRHFQVAARNQGMGQLGNADAELLCGRSFEDIRCAARRGRPFANALRRLKAYSHAAAAPVPEAASAVTPDGRTRLEDMHGYGEAKQWGLELARDIVDWRNGAIGWTDVDAGALLVGPPGCGKTIYAAALAESCGVGLVVASAASWQAKGHLGDMLRAMQRTFDEAKRTAPCLLFLDEFDSFGDRSSEDGNADYRRQVINGLLEQLDGAGGREGVVVLAAANDPSGIDPALLRAGRVERRIDIRPPDTEARIEILKFHLPAAKLFGDFRKFADSTDGLTGADIAMTARTARRLARRAGREVTEADVLAALPPSRPLTADELLMVAVHEAGHVVVAMVLDVDRIEHVRIADRVVAKGVQSLGRTRFLMKPAIGRTAEYHLAKIAMLLAGVAAEEAVFGAFCDGAGANDGADLALATELATMLECQLGMGSTLLHEPGDVRLLRTTNTFAWRRVDELVRTQFDRAKSIVEARRPAVDRLARALVARGYLTGEEARAVVLAEPPRDLQFGSASATT